ncbi:MAG: type VI secretion system tip protein TssI/VgrG [Pseudomonadota bacterium]
MTVSQSLQISIAALSLDAATCEWFVMEEAVSNGFRLEVIFTSPRDYSGAQIVGQHADFRFEHNGAGRAVGGVILEFRVLNKIDINSYTYGVVIGPRLALLDRIRQSEIFASDGGLPIRALLDGVLSGSLSEGATAGARNFTLDYRILDDVPSGFPRRNITKYNESDLQFFARNCEHYGIFYYIDFQAADGTVKDVVVVGSGNEAFQYASPQGWRFRADATTTAVDDHVVSSITAVSRPALSQYSLRDYDYETPSNKLLVPGTPREGIGAVVDYGDHYWTVEDGTALARIRAEEADWQTRQFECESSIPTLGAGRIFALKDHPISAFNSEFVILSVRHEAGQRGALGYRLDTADTTYRNSFTAIPKAHTFRPRRVTPRPIMSGVYTAVVETDDPQNKRGALDSSGRYRIALRYNEGANRHQQGKGSGPVRQMQPYAGGSANSVVSGLHFPLVGATEVLVSYENGDPDRPVILGAAFNGANINPVTSQAHTTNRLRTTGGALLEMEDGHTDSDARYIRLDVPTTVADKVPSGTYLRLGAPASGEDKARSGVLYSGAAGPQATSGHGVLLYSEHDLEQHIVGASVTKVGQGQSVEVKSGDLTLQVDAGQFQVSAFDDVTITAGPAGSTSGSADVTINASNDINLNANGDANSYTYGNKIDRTIGNTLNMTIGWQHSFNLGAVTTMQLAMYLKITLGSYSSVTVGAKWDLVVGSSGKLCLQQDMKIASDDYKIVGTDMKVAETDFKAVHLDLKKAWFSYDEVNSKLNSAQLTAEKGDIFQKMIDTSFERLTSKVQFVKISTIM